MSLRDAYTRYPRPILWLIPEGRIRLSKDQPEVEVEPFYLSKFPVTNEQFQAFDPAFEPSPRSPGERDPATGISYEQASAYCAWYAQVSRKPMRLPTEAEWLHACRAGTPGDVFVGDEALDEHVWHAGNSGATMPALDGRRANPFGLWSMLGGVWEWVEAEPPALRGGSILTPRSSIGWRLRRSEPAASRSDDAGFRIAKSMRS